MQRHLLMRTRTIVVTALYGGAVCLAQIVMPLVALPATHVLAAVGNAKLEVIDTSLPTSDPGRFDFKIDGIKLASSVGDSGTTGTQTVAGASSHVVLEQASSSATMLSSYTTNVTCRDQHGAGSVLASSNPTGASSRQLTVTTPTDSEVVCVFTNTRQTGTVMVINQVTNDSGGTAAANDFDITLGTYALPSNEPTTVPTGTYTLNEVGLPGYTAISIVGSGCPTQLGGTISVTKGQTISCTITHDDQPGQLRVMVNVTNDNGGTLAASAFALFVNDQPITQNAYVAENAGSYTMSESVPNGYAQTSLTCADDHTNQSVSHPVVLGIGQTVTCTIINDDIAPSLHVVDNIINDNGGTATPGDTLLSVGGSNQYPQNFAPSQGGSDITLQAGDYGIGATTLLGYALRYSPDCTGTIALGEQRTCAITYDDLAPTLIVTAAVINNSGGNAELAQAQLYVNDLAVASGAPHEFNAGNYTVSELPPPGYTASSWSGDCQPDGSITLHVGGNYACFITINDIAPTLLLRRSIINDNGGTTNGDSFQAFIDGKLAPWDEPVTLLPGSHSLTQTVPAGYNASAWKGDCSFDGTVTLAAAEAKTCTITYDDQPANLAIVESVINDNGGTMTTANFGFTVNGGPSQTVDSAGKAVLLLAAGTYTVQPAHVNGYSATYSGCTGVVLAIGQTATCTITYDDQAPTLTMYNQSTPSGQQVFAFTSLELGSFTLTGDDTMDGVKQFANLLAGEYVISALSPPGWSIIAVSCDTPDTTFTNTTLTVTLRVGSNVSCYFSSTPTAHLPASGTSHPPQQDAADVSATNRISCSNECASPNNSAPNSKQLITHGQVLSDTAADHIASNPGNDHTAIELLSALFGMGVLVLILRRPKRQAHSRVQ